MEDTKFGCSVHAPFIPAERSERPFERISEMKRLIAFDLDGTLAESKLPISKTTAELLGALLGVMCSATITESGRRQL